MNRLFIVGMVLLLGGCATGGTATAPVDVAGTWNGSVTGQFSFPFVMVLEQNGSTVTGNISSSAPRGGYNGPIRGTVTGNLFSWTSGSDSGALTVDGNEMSGRGTQGLSPYESRLHLRRAK